jgi:hypothetical protein
MLMRSEVGSQRKVLVFQASEANPSALMSLSASARDIFKMSAITIFDHDGGSLMLTRADLGLSGALDAELDLTVGAGGGGVVTPPPAPTGFVTWGANTGPGQYTVTGSSIQKNGGLSYNASVRTVEEITSGDGYFEFVINNASTTENFIAGLASGAMDSDGGYTHIDFGINLSSNVFRPYENGTGRNQINQSAPNGTVVRVAVESGVVKYYINGGLVFTSSNTPSYPLYGVISMYNTAGISDAKLLSV